MSLRWRLLGAFLLVIVVAVALAVLGSQLAATTQLSDFTKAVGSVTAKRIADGLAAAHADAGGWAGTAVALARMGFLSEAAAARHGVDERILARLPRKPDASASSETRIVVLDAANRVVLDTHGELPEGAAAPDLAGLRASIGDPTKGVLGNLHFDVDGTSLVAERTTFLINTVVAALRTGLATLVIAALLGIWLVRGIVAPVSALTRATQAIARGESAAPIPVSSTDELGQMSAAFNDMAAALRTQLELRSRLIDDVSHELYTPLSVILLEAKGLQDGIQTPELAAGHIMGEVATLRHMVEDLSLVAELEAGELRLDLESRRIEEVLRDEVERWRLQARSQAVTLTLRPAPEGLPSVLLDATRFGQALGNLLKNGLQHTRPGTAVDVACRRAEGGVVVSVRDTGSGIAEADLPFVFERFYRADASRQRATGGRGLGLAIAKRIIEAHGGRIWAQSTLGSGSCFQVFLPGAGAPRSSAEE